MAELPSGTVTFLFTDVEGSTRLWEDHPDGMQVVLARHDEIVRDAIESHGGHVVKTTGDGFLAAFGTGRDALDAALAAQRTLMLEPPSEGVIVKVRMGVHTGEARARDGDYYGPALNRAARLMAVAHGGQVVCSQATADLARDVLVEGVVLVDLGEHRLRDLSRAERVFQVNAPGLTAEFPPLRSLDAYAGNLPLQATSFVGRDVEVASVAESLRSWRLVTVTGVGGVGKTRLAVQVAAELLPAFADGAWLCELAAASDPDALVQVIAATLGVQPRGGLSLEASVVEFLGPRSMLVVLDNCEHLLDAAAGFSEAVLGHCPAVRLLATSREALAVAGEQVWPLRSLALPTEGSLNSALASAATRLFAERARAVAPGFVLGAENAPAVAEVCRRLDGIPLAIELAASRVGAMSPGEIEGLLDERFRLLTGGRRTAVERHQTLRATVDWSYSLLGVTDQRVFDRLGVFSGPFDAAAAAEVAMGGGVEAWDMRDALAGLVGRSMLIAEPGGGGATRYAMLETLRAYARERLDETTDADVWRRNHARHYEQLAEEIGAALSGPDELAARLRFQTDLDNLRAAFTWALDRDDPADVELGIGVVAALAPAGVSDVASGIGMWAEQALPYLPATTAARRAQVLSAAAWWRIVGRADSEGAAALAREALREGTVGVFFSWNTLAHTAAIAGDFDTVWAVLEDAQAALDATGAPAVEQAMLLTAWGIHLVTAGDLDQARTRAEAAIRIARDVANPSVLAIALFALAYATWQREPAVALPAVEESIALTRAGGSDSQYAPALVIAARLRSRAGDARGALQGLRDAVAHCQRVGDHNGLAFAVRATMQTFAARGEAVVATEFLGAFEAGALSTVNYQLGGPEAERRSDAHATLRATLGDATFEAKFSYGATMSYDQIPLLAIATLDALLTGTSQS